MFLGEILGIFLKLCFIDQWYYILFNTLTEEQTQTEEFGNFSDGEYDTVDRKNNLHNHIINITPSIMNWSIFYILY